MDRHGGLSSSSLEVRGRSLECCLHCYFRDPALSRHPDKTFRGVLKSILFLEAKTTGSTTFKSKTQYKGLSTIPLLYHLSKAFRVILSMPLKQRRLICRS